VRPRRRCPSAGARLIPLGPRFGARRHCGGLHILRVSWSGDLALAVCLAPLRGTPNLPGVLVWGRGATAGARQIHRVSWSGDLVPGAGAAPLRGTGRLGGRILSGTGARFGGPGRNCPPRQGKKSPNRQTPLPPLRGGSWEAIFASTALGPARALPWVSAACCHCGLGAPHVRYPACGRGGTVWALFSRFPAGVLGGACLRSGPRRRGGSALVIPGRARYPPGRAATPPPRLPTPYLRVLVRLPSG
jgi:hypothetical protein